MPYDKIDDDVASVGGTMILIVVFVAGVIVGIIGTLIVL
jgi:hypothetical protein